MPSKTAIKISIALKSLFKILLVIKKLLHRQKERRLLFKANGASLISFLTSGII
jgi:hypothetical protein